MAGYKESVRGVNPKRKPPRSRGPTGIRDVSDPDYRNEGMGDSRGPVGVQDRGAEAAERPRASRIPTNSSKRVYFAWSDGKPVIYEYQSDGELCSKLMFPQSRNRGYYREGDIIFQTELPQHVLEDLYSELKPRPGEEESVAVSLFKGFLLGPPDEYKVSQRIEKISPSSWGGGDGRIVMRALLHLDEETRVELEKKLVETRSELNIRWIYYDNLVRGLEVVATVGKWFAEASMLVMGGAGRGVARAGARRIAVISLKNAMRRAGTRILVRKVWLTLRKNMVKNTAVASKAFVTTFVKELEKRKDIETLGRRASSGDQEFKHQVVRPAIAKGFGAFATTLISTSLTPGLEKALGSSGQLNDISRNIVLRITTPFTIGVPNLFLGSIAEAAAQSANSSRGFDTLLAEAMQKQTLDLFKSIVSPNGELGQLGEAMAK